MDEPRNGNHIGIPGVLFWCGLPVAAVWLGRYFWPPVIRVAVDALGADVGLFFVLGWAPTGLGMVLLAAAPVGDEAFRRRPWTFLLGACAVMAILQLGLLRLGPRLTGVYVDVLLAYVLGMYAAWAMLFTVLPVMYLAIRALTAWKQRGHKPLANIASRRPARILLAVSELAAVLALLPWAAQGVAAIR
ncbi:hypothetical protein KBX37_29630 [Micromonospora sp. U56]|uniref:hypothetical protein n=1 Tax=Micromonospora sp. U56 TaxID=2824900 RepID=UPI001B360CCB|nr:hypothetical protein [Micromonospora sp. U56]MBQ0897191.1 hypothetical protein [Micromonospora sp. U56]